MGRPALYATVFVYFFLLAASLAAIAAGYDHIPTVTKQEIQFKFLHF